MRFRFFSCLKKVLVFVGVICFCQLGYGDVLFVDLNNSQEEIRAAQQAARLRGEKLVVIPQVTERARLAIESLSQRTETLAARIHKECQTAACSDLLSEHQKAVSELSALTKEHRLDSESLARGLKLAEQSKTQFSSVVISGHDGNGKFTGVLGTLESSSLEEAFAKAPNASRNVQSVLLWGCYTTTLGSLDGHWKKVFPNVSVFAGFDGRGPAKNRPANHTYLEDFLKVDRELSQAADKERVQSLVKAIRGFDQTKSSICVGDWMATPGGVKGLSALRGLCQLSAEDQKLIDQYHCFREARTQECENPPIKTDRSVLRDLYNRLQERSHCYEVWAQSGEHQDVPEPQNVLSLLFFNNIKLNLAALHREQLVGLDSLLEKMGAEPSLRVANLPRMSRAQIINRLAEIEKFLERPEFRGIMHEKAILADHAKSALMAINGLVTKMDLVPVGWIEANDSTTSAELVVAVSADRRRDVEVEHGVLFLERKFAADKKQLMSEHVDYDRLSQLRVDANAKLRSGVSAQATLIEIAKLQRSIESAVGEVLAAKVAARVQSGEVPEASVTQYLKQLRMRR